VPIRHAAARLLVTRGAPVLAVGSHPPPGRDRAEGEAQGLIWLKKTIPVRGTFARIFSGRRSCRWEVPGLTLISMRRHSSQMAFGRPKATRHLYEILTAPQPPLVSAVLSGEHIVELARLRDFL
jgi:hypothetical protein